MKKAKQFSLPFLIFLVFLILHPAQGSTYVLTGESWSGSTTTFHVKYDSGTYDSAFTQALNAWNGLSNFSYTSLSTSADPCTKDGKNSYGFSSTQCGSSWDSETLAVTRWWYDNSTNRLTEADIIFNSSIDYSVFNGTNGQRYDFRRIAVHELGHAFGLDHSDVKSAIMYYRYQNSVETPQSDDISGIKAIYGGGGSTPSCSYSITPTSATADSQGGTSSVSVSTSSGCSWSASSNSSWITVNSGASGSGSGTVSYTVATHTGTSSRTGTITIAGNSFTVTQTGTSTCSYTISPESQGFDGEGGSDTVTVSTKSECAWTASSGTSWITIDSGSSGTGPGTISYTVSSHTGTTSRTGYMTIAGKTFNVTQAGASSCKYAISDTGRNFDSTGGSGAIFVTTTSSCTWTAKSNSSWLQVNSGTSGVGNGTITYLVGKNFEGSNRTGTITVGGQTYTVTQSGNGCSTSLSPEEAAFEAEGGSASLTVNAVAGCQWTATSDKAWVVVTSGATGSGSGTIAYVLSANTDPADRTGTITVQSSTLAITQKGSTTLTPVYRLYDPATSGIVFTTTQAEYDYIKASNPHYLDFGIAFYAYKKAVSGALPIYRFYDAAKNAFLYTLSTGENDYIRQAFPQYAYLGIAFYAPRESSANTTNVYRFANISLPSVLYTISDMENYYVLHSLSGYSSLGTAFTAYPYLYGTTSTGSAQRTDPARTER